MNWQAEFERSWFEPLSRISSGSSVRLAVLAAHPDDETIGASVLLARCRNACVIFVTDGAPRDNELWPETIEGSREQYAAIRRHEAERALAHAGIPARQITWLGGVDQEAIFTVPQLLARLLHRVDELQPELLVTHPYEGGHPDHDCAALLASIALRPFRKHMPLFEITSYHARDGRLVTGEFLGSNPAEEWLFELSAEDKIRKSKMFAEYRSQQEVLKSFGMDRERVRLARAYDFREPPHEGKLWYECLGWAMTGERWRALAAAAEEREPSCR
jgi:LmbE family N-acetylglucosaminyl deacetylase